RVASRRLREALPVLTDGLQHTKSGKAQRKIRRLTEALGTVRELDVTLHLIDELADRPAVPQAALREVRALVIEEREQRRAVMLDRLKEIDQDKLTRRLQSVRAALAAPAPGHSWRGGSRGAAGASRRRSSTPGRSTHLKGCTRCASPPRSSATRWKSPTRAGRWRSPRRCARSSASRRRSAACTICRCCTTMPPRSAPRRARGAARRTRSSPC